MYVPSTRKIISSYDVVSGENISSVLAYASQPYSEVMAFHLIMTYTPYATSSKEKTGNIIMLTRFEEGGLLSETR